LDREYETKRTVYNTDKEAYKQQVTGEVQQARQEGRLDEIADRYEDLYSLVEKVAQAGYLEIPKEDTEVLEALRVLREAGFFDYIKYNENIFDIYNKDEKSEKLKPADYELIVPYRSIANLDEEGEYKYIGTIGDENPVKPNPVIEKQMASMLTFADVMYALDCVKLTLPTPEQVFSGYTSNPKYYESTFGDVGPTYEYNGNGLDGDGNETGETMEEFLKEAKNRADNMAQSMIENDDSTEYLKDFLEKNEQGQSKVDDDNTTFSANEMAGKRNNIKVRNAYEMLMADGENPDILSELRPIIDLIQMNLIDGSQALEKALELESMTEPDQSNNVESIVKYLTHLGINHTELKE
jgi:hypothetical protein